MSIKQSQYFRLSLTSQCNLDCYFCHNEGQNKNQYRSNQLSCDDIVWVCDQMKQSGFTKFKLTGGEPTLRQDLPLIIDGLRKLGIDDLSLISNGTLLENKASILKSVGLQRINVSLYSLEPDRFKQNNGGSIKKLEAVKRGIEAALNSGYTDMKINYVYHGKEALDDLKEVLKYVSNKNLTLVILPLIPINLKGKDEETSLSDLYQIIKDLGISKEELITDAEGIKKRLITTTDNAKILLRVDELKDKMPFKQCSQCANTSDCKEGIFPLRMSSSGIIYPCLAGGRESVPMKKIIKMRDSKRFIDTIQSINNESILYVSMH